MFVISAVNLLGCQKFGKKRPPEYTAEEGHEVAGTRAWDRRKQGAGRVQQGWY
jgi:hypothetical protein